MNQQEKVNEMFEKLRSSGSNIIMDGIVEEAEYYNARYKIAYILKEVNSTEAQDWDLRDYVRDGGQSASWNNIARWTEGILNLEKDYSRAELEKNNENRRSIYLKKICVINLKKTPGGSSSNDKEIYISAQENKELIKAQLKLADPNIIICCGTEVAFMEAVYPELCHQWTEADRDAWYVKDGDTIIISFKHPQARVKLEEMHMNLTYALRKLL